MATQRDKPIYPFQPPIDLNLNPEFPSSIIGINSENWKEVASKFKEIKLWADNLSRSLKETQQHTIQNFNLHIQNPNFHSYFSGVAAPTVGTWAQGDRVFNSAPSASGWIGWVCVVAGTPGTWKGFGAIEA